MINKIRDVLIRIRLYILRTSNYFAMFNFIMIIYLTISDLSSYGINIDIKQYGLIIFGGAFLVMILFGWFDYKLLWAREQEISTYKNPQVMKTLKIVKEIQQELKQK